MPFYVVKDSVKERNNKVVKVLSDMICNINGVWEISSKEILRRMGEPPGSLLHLVQREGKEDELEFEVLKFIGYTHRDESNWWAPVAIQGIEIYENGEKGKELVHCFVYIVSEYPHYFADSRSYGPNLWPEALLAISKRILADIELEILRRGK